MDSRKETLRAIKVYASDLKVPSPLKSELVLAAIAHNESNYGKDNVPRHEPAYDHGGRYADKVAIEEYGRDAACSWSPWQIMYVNAKAMGFEGAPKDLSDPHVALPFVIKFINKEIINRQKAMTMQDIARAYNSGSIHGDAVKGYVGNVLLAYDGQETKDFLNGVIK